MEVFIKDKLYETEESVGIYITFLALRRVCLEFSLFFCKLYCSLFLSEIYHMK